MHGIQEDLDWCDLVSLVRLCLVVALHSSRLELMGNEQPLAIAGGHKPVITQQRLRLNWTEAFLLGPTQQVTLQRVTAGLIICTTPETVPTIWRRDHMQQSTASSKRHASGPIQR